MDHAVILQNGDKVLWKHCFLGQDIRSDDSF